MAALVSDPCRAIAKGRDACGALGPVWVGPGGPVRREQPLLESLLVWAHGGCSQPGSGCGCAVPVPLPRQGQHPVHHCFVVEVAEDGSFRASAAAAAIHIEADTLEELFREITGAVVCHCDPGEAPPLIRLHHVMQELLAL